MAFGLDQYHMLLFADLDVDLYPPTAPLVMLRARARARVMLRVLPC